MPRINRNVIWFDDVKIINEGVFDTPFGRVSFRQMAYLGLFGFAAWCAFSALKDVDMIFSAAAAAGLIFIIGVIFASWRIKTVPIERSILLAMGIGRKHPKRKKPPKPTKATRVPKPPPPVPVKTSKMMATVGEPIKIVGILREPATGIVLAHRGFSVIIDGRSHYKGATDEQGSFEVVYLPEQPGLVKIEVKPDGYTFSETIDLTVR